MFQWKRLTRSHHLHTPLVRSSRDENAAPPASFPGVIAAALGTHEQAGKSATTQQRKRNSLFGAAALCLAVGALITGCEGNTAVQDRPTLEMLSNNVTDPPQNYYAGNDTSVGDSASDSTSLTSGAPGTVLVRQPDCSLAAETFSNVQLTTSNGYNGTFAGTFTATQTPTYSNTLHQLAGLTTKPGVFAKGCTDNVAGIAGLPGVLLAHTSAGLYVGASVDFNNNLYIGAINPNGTFTATRLSLTLVGELYVGDLNSEGIRQLIVEVLVPSTTGGESGSGLYTINVHPDGTFDAPVLLSTLANASLAVTVDDFTGDGKLDIGYIPLLNGRAQPFTVLPGLGNGTFGPAITSVTPVNLPGGNAPVLTGDFNGDGKRDVIAYGSILFGKGDGTFTLGPAAPSIEAYVVGDFNNDGKDDIAGTAPGGIAVQLGNGDGTFTQFGPTYASVYGGYTLAVTDIDGDGNLDLVAGLGQSGIYGPPMNGQGITMFLMGHGDGTFHGANGYGYSAASGVHGAFAIGDFNGDGNTDVLTVSRTALGNTAGLQVLTGNGKGVLTPQPVNTSVIPGPLVAADVNGDGKLDALTLNSTQDNSGNYDPSLVVLTGNGNATFAAPVSYPIPPASTSTALNFAVGNIRGNGTTDAVVSFNGLLYILKNNGNGTFAAATQVDSQADYESLTVADVNGDGKADIIALSGSLSFGTLTNAQILVYLSKGDGTFAAPLSVDSIATAQDLIVQDVNSDGKPDLVLLSSSQSTGAFSLTTYLGHGDGTFASGTASSLVGSAFTSLASADVNGDGKPDVLIAACCGDTLSSISYGNGDGTFSTSYGLSIGSSVNSAQFADLNNDGRPDLVLASNYTLVTSLNEFGVVSALTPTSTVLSLNPASPTAGQTITFSATVTAATGTATPTGTVTFYDGTTSLGTGTLSSGAASFTGSLAAGSHSITASYSGDANDAASVSPADTFTIATAPTPAPTATQLTASATTATAGTAIALNATVKETTGTSTPTGTVTYYDGSASLGTASLASGAASLSVSSLAVGTHSLTAAYAGDSGNAASTSSILTVTITSALPPGFSAALSPTSGTVQPGGSVTTNISVLSSNGFNQAVSFACSGLPAHTSCSFSPSSVTPGASGGATTQLTIKTDVSPSALNTYPLSGRESDGAISMASLAGGTWLAFLLFSARRKGKRPNLQLAVLATLLLISSAAVGCGSSKPVTPAGTTPVSITATSGSVTQTLSYSLTVQ